MVLVDQTSYNTVNGTNTIAYMSCDTAGDNDSYISPSDMLIALAQGDIAAVLLYSVDKEYCSLTTSDFDSLPIWTMTSADDARTTRDSTDASKGAIIAVISGNGASGGPGGYPPVNPEGGSNSAVAMSILYSITGIITLLFLIIIGSGAIRAHRHPERYGPRPGYGGRPRQSRAKGLARAVLDTLPIVKFGDSSRPVKTDPEHELESATGDRHQANSPSPNEALAGPMQQQDAPSEADPASKPDSDTATGVASRENPASIDGNEHIGCSICTEDFTLGEDVRVLPCDHKFHPQCVDPWLVNVSGTCPLW